MKIKPGFKIRKMCGSSVVVPTGKAASEFNGMITLNETGELLWNRLAEGAEKSDLISLLMKEFDIDEITASTDVGEFIDKIKGAGFIE